MTLKVVSLQNKGDADHEYVMLEAEKDCDLGYYLVADTTFMESGKISNRLRHVFWFPNKSILKGDLVSLRTGVGDSTTVTNSSGQKVHRFFWGLKSAVWNDEADRAVVIQAKTWSTFPKA